MRIEETPARLVIDRASWIDSVAIGAIGLAILGFGLVTLWDGQIGGLGIMGIGAAVLAYMALQTERVRLVLDRETGEILHLRRSFRESAETRRPLAELREAVVVRPAARRGGDPARMSLVLTDGTLDFTRDAKDDSTADRAAEAVNRWLAAGAPR